MNQSQLLKMLLAWVERAIAILEAATVPPPPANQAERVGNLLSYLFAPAPIATIPPRNTQNLRQDLKDHFVATSDTVLQVMTKTQPALESVFYAAYRNFAYRAPLVEEPPGLGRVELLALTADTPSTPIVYAFRVTASLFGSKAQRQPKYEPAFIPDPNSGEESPPLVQNPNGGNPLPWDQWDRWKKDKDEADNVIFLDAAYDKIRSGPESYVVLQNPDGATVFKKAKAIESFGDIEAIIMSRTAYGYTGNTTKITLPEPWRIEPAAGDDGTQWERILYGTVVHAQSEELPLALEPVHQGSRETKLNWRIYTMDCR